MFLPSLEIEHFPSDLQPVFAAVSGSWNATGRLDAVEICARYPEQKEAIIGCVAECESECIAITRDRVEEWTQLAREQAALARVQGIAVQIANSLTTFADLPDLYSQMGEALTLDREAQDFKPIGELVDNYVRKLDEKPRYIPTGLSVLETDPDTLTARIIANRLAVPLADVKAKSVPQSDLDDLAKLHKLPLFIRSASGKGVAWVKAQAQRMKAQVVFIDYLQLLATGKARDRYQQITSISIALHELAQTTGILVVALAQLNRNSAQSLPTVADLKESGQIEQDADAILLLANDVTTQNRPEKHYHCSLEKNKEGDLWTLPITFDKECQRFLEITSEFERR